MSVCVHVCMCGCMDVCGCLLASMFMCVYACQRMCVYIPMHASVGICIYVPICLFTGQRKSGVGVDAQTSHGLNLVLHNCQPSMVTYRDTYKTE